MPCLQRTQPLNPPPQQRVVVVGRVEAESSGSHPPLRSSEGRLRGTETETGAANEASLELAAGVTGLAYARIPLCVCVCVTAPLCVIETKEEAEGAGLPIGPPNQDKKNFITMNECCWKINVLAFIPPSTTPIQAVFFLALLFSFSLTQKVAL